MGICRSSFPGSEASDEQGAGQDVEKQASTPTTKYRENVYVVNQTVVLFTRNYSSRCILSDFSQTPATWAQCLFFIASKKILAVITNCISDICSRSEMRIEFIVLGASPVNRHFTRPR